MKRLIFVLIGLLSISVFEAYAQTSPRLIVQSVAPQTLRIAWPDTAIGFILEQTSFLADSSLWQPVVQTPTDQNNEFSVLVNAAQGNQFFRLTLAAFTSIRETSPVEGETGVAVIRETIVHFTAPLATNTVITTDNFYAGYGGRKLLSRVELSADRKKATLFYLEPLPGSTRVYAVFNGTGLTDELGRPIDADGDGVPGGLAVIAFDTANVTPLTGTAVTGQVFASDLMPGPDTGTNAVNRPLEGVIITVDGMEETLSATTDASGKFTLAPAPPGRFFVKIDGRKAKGSEWLNNGAYYPYVGKAWDAVAGRTNNLAGGTGQIFLPLITAGTLKPVSITTDTTIGFPPSVISNNPALAGVSITVPANSLFSDNGARGGKVGIAPVPPDRLPGPLPQGLELPLVITVQTDGPLNFDRPAPVCFPNLPDPITGQVLPPGAKGALISFNHKKGIWEAVGSMTVSVDGKMACTDPGSGILQPGWHGGPVPPPSGPPPPCPDPGPVPQSSSSFGGPLEALTKTELAQRKSVKPGGTGTESCGNGDPPPPCTPNLEAVADCIEGCRQTASYQTEIAQVLFENAMSACTNAAVIKANQTGGNYKNFLHPCVDVVRARLWARIKQIEADNQACKKKCSECWGLPVPPGKFSTVSSVEDQILQMIQNIADLLTPYEGSGIATPPAVEAQIADMESSIDVLAGGDATPFLLNRAVEHERERLGLSETSYLIRGNAPAYPVLYAAEIARGLEAMIVRGQTQPNGQYSIFVPRDGKITSVSFYDPRTKGYAEIFPNLRPEAQYTLPHFTLATLSADALDSDHDGLPDAIELVYGTDPDNPDSDGDGIPDGTEVEQGTDPLDGRPAQTGFIAVAKTPGAAIDICTMNNLAILAEGTAGVSIFNVFDNLNPALIAQIDTPGSAQRVACSSSNLIAVADGASGLAVIDATDLSAARIARQVPLGGTAQSVTTAGNLAYVGLDNGDIVTVDMLTGIVLDRLNATGAVQDIALGGDHLFALLPDKLVSVSFTDGLSSVAGSVPSPYPAAPNQRLFVGGDIAYAVHAKGYNTFSLTNPAAPALIAAGNTKEFGWKALAPNGSGLGIASVGPNLSDDAPHTVRLYDVSDPTKTDVFLTEFPMPGRARAVSIFNGLAYIAADVAGLQIVNYLPYDAKGVPPTISLSTSFPTNGVEEGQNVRVAASVADDVQVRDVAFYVDGAKVATDGNFPFEYRFVVPLRATNQTSFRLSALATDTGGNTKSSGDLVIPILPDRTPPRIVRFMPADGTVFPTNAPLHFSARLSEAINPATLTTNSFQIFSVGPDGRTGTIDDTPVLGGTVSYRADLNTAYLDLGSLGVGAYHIAMKAPLADLAGNVINPPGEWTIAVADTYTIIYSRVDSDQGTIWQARGDGSSDHQIATGNRARLSPDGVHLAIERGGASSSISLRGSIFARNLQSTNETLLFGNNGDYVVDFDWEADGTRLIFDFSCQIYEVGLDGPPNPPRQFEQQGNCYSDAPTINRVDQGVAFHNQFIGILLMDSNGSGETVVPNTQPGDSWPAWSPDGQWISFLRTKPSPNYFKIGRDGTGLTQLTSISAPSGDAFSSNGSSAIWVPDGHALLAPAKIGGVQGLYSIPADGSGNLTRIPLSAGADIDSVGSAVLDSPPKVLRVDPGDLEGVRLVTVYFTKSLDPDTVTSEGAALIFAGPDGVLGTSDDSSTRIDSVTYDAAQFAIVLKFNTSLPPGKYRLVVQNSIADETGHFMTGPFQSEFLAEPVNLIKNGGFEQIAYAGSGYLFSTDTRFNLPGWSVPLGGNQFFIEFGQPFGVPRYYEGRQAVCINSDGAQGKMSQTFGTVIGGSYTLRFALAEEQGPRPSSTRVRVEAGDLSRDVDLGNTPGFALEEFTFTAQAAQTTLTFTDLTPGSAAGHSPFIDAVKVFGPEPAATGP